MLSSRPSRSNSSSLSSMVVVLWILLFIIMPTNVHSFGNNNNNNININNIGNAIFDGISKLGSSKNKKINMNQSVTNILFDKLNKLIQQSPKNGINTPPELESEILRIAQALGTKNSTEHSPGSVLLYSILSWFYCRRFIYVFLVSVCFSRVTHSLNSISCRGLFFRQSESNGWTNNVFFVVLFHQ